MSRPTFIPENSSLPQSVLAGANRGSGVEADFKDWLKSVFRSGDAPGKQFLIHDGRGRALPVSEWWIGPEGDIHVEVIAE